MRECVREFTSARMSLGAIEDCGKAQPYVQSEVAPSEETLRLAR